METKNSDLMAKEYSANGKIITFHEPLIMAIVNLTPDSFYDGGKYSEVEDVLRDVDEKLRNGAHIIDIGAASSRPGAKEIAIEDEWQRLSAYLSSLRREFPAAIISIDTWRAEIARRSALEGADMINDIGGGKLDDKMAETVAKLNLPYVLMHIQGNPGNMQKNPVYEDVTAEVKNLLQLQLQKLEVLGFKKIIVDPGFGFGKNLEHNYTLMRNLEQFTDLGYPLLVGISRKGMINQVLGTSPVTALNGTTVLNTIALLNGASILRVHDVTEAKQTIELVRHYKRSQ